MFSASCAGVGSGLAGGLVASSDSAEFDVASESSGRVEADWDDSGANGHLDCIALNEGDFGFRFAGCAGIWNPFQVGGRLYFTRNGENRLRGINVRRRRLGGYRPQKGSNSLRDLIMPRGNGDGVWTRYFTPHCLNR